MKMFLEEIAILVLLSGVAYISILFMIALILTLWLVFEII